MARIEDYADRLIEQRDSLVSYLRRFFPLSVEEAEDVYGNHLLSLTEGGMNSYEGVGDFDCWLRTGVINKARDYLRKKRSDKRGGKENFVDFDDNHHDYSRSRGLISRFDTSIDIGDALERIDPFQRKVVLMRACEGMTFPEISKILKKGEKSVKYTFYRTRDELKKDHLREYSREAA